MKKLFLHELFIDQSMQEPNAIAVKTADKKLTYRTLFNLSNNLACLLKEKGANSNQLIAVVMPKGHEQVVAVLGILMAGSAYLPIDPIESGERLHYLLRIAKVKIILTDKKLANKLNWPDDCLIISVDNIQEETKNQPLTSNGLTPKDLAYVIFTSGSTGVPKGVMISHENAVNTILDINERFNVKSSDKVFGLSNLTFDLSVYDIFGTLAAGATIILPGNEKDPTQWHDLFFREKISIWNSVPTLIDIFIEYLGRKNSRLNNAQLRLVLLSGDWIPLNLPQKIFSFFRNAQIISLGGATEGSIWSILYPINEVDPSWKSIPYGKPMKNQTFYIFNEKFEPVINEESGELYIGGIGVAKGYWGDVERTNAQFIQHPQFGRIYKTGDMGRYLPDGNIEFLGRVDFQVKIGGFRVEINAIEKYLLDVPEIKQAVVVVTKDQNQPKLATYLNFDYSQFLNNEENTILQNNQIKYWEKIYDNLCKKENSCNDDPTFNIVGWVSSYTNQPIPKIQMKEWLDNTIKRIALMNPQNILEIGCGMGLLLFRLAKISRHYVASDFSTDMLSYLESHLPKYNINNVHLIECQATDIHKINQTFDTIILNSVIQYFPSIDYLLDVISQCIKKITGKGYIFIGDIRSLHLLEEFHASVLLSKKIDNLSLKDWKYLLMKAIKDEDELVVDFNFFHALRSKFPEITQVEIQLKEGKYHNEMNTYRYDVILYINHKINNFTEEIREYDWRSKQMCSHLKAIHLAIAQDSPPIFLIRNIPNKRITYPLHFIKNLPYFLENQNELLKEYLLDKDKAIDPEIFYQIAHEHDYHASITWSSRNPSECFDVILVKKFLFNSSKAFLSLLQGSMDNSKISWDSYANNPLLPLINRKLISKTKKFLQAYLPHYMIPSYFIPIEEIPITPNGKIDRNGLPKIIIPTLEREYIEPYTNTQKKILEIWRKMLGIKNISIKHNLFDLGGTSLLSIQLLIDLHDVFGVDLSLQDLTIDLLTVEKLSALIDKRVYSSSRQ